MTTLPVIPETLAQKSQQIYHILLEQYGQPTWTELDPVSELVNTILSQNTNDRNRDLAYARLRARMPTWTKVQNATLDNVIEAVRPAGLAKQKAAAIQNALHTISQYNQIQNKGKPKNKPSTDLFSLHFLQHQLVEQARAWLTALDGVGPKTASIVLLFCFHMHTFPVDTHVYRVTGRLGLRPEKMSIENTHHWMERLSPPDTPAAFHLNLIQHGRKICQARQPHCALCPLQQHCSFYTQNSHLSRTSI